MTGLASYPVGLYLKATAAESHLFNGAEYVDYRKPNREGHQFFLQDQSAMGKVRYDGALYEQVPLLYDLVKDEVVIVKEGLLKQKLVSEKVAGFVLEGHLFVRHVGQDSLGQASLPTGFYDVLFDGQTQLLAKRSKRIKNEKREKEVEIYVPEDTYYIKKDSLYHQVKSKGSVFKVFKDKKKELKKLTRNHGFSFQLHRESAILAIVKEYEALLNK
ncbi:MAG: hypothetical protein ACO1OQ_15025 [Rufibacter sp.]